MVEIIKVRQGFFLIRKLFQLKLEEKIKKRILFEIRLKALEFVESINGCLLSQCIIMNFGIELVNKNHEETSEKKVSKNENSSLFKSEVNEKDNIQDTTNNLVTNQNTVNTKFKLNQKSEILLEYFNIIYEKYLLCLYKSNDSQVKKHGLKVVKYCLAHLEVPFTNFLLSNLRKVNENFLESVLICDKTTNIILTVVESSIKYGFKGCEEIIMKLNKICQRKNNQKNEMMENLILKLKMTSYNLSCNKNNFPNNDNFSNCFNTKNKRNIDKGVQGGSNRLNDSNTLNWKESYETKSIIDNSNCYSSQKVNEFVKTENSNDLYNNINNSVSFSKEEKELLLFLLNESSKNKKEIDLNSSNISYNNNNNNNSQFSKNYQNQQPNQLRNSNNNINFPYQNTNYTTYSTSKTLVPNNNCYYNGNLQNNYSSNSFLNQGNGYYDKENMNQSYSNFHLFNNEIANKDGNYNKRDLYSNNICDVNLSNNKNFQNPLKQPQENKESNSINNYSLNFYYNNGNSINDKYINYNNKNFNFNNSIDENEYQQHKNNIYSFYTPYNSNYYQFQPCNNTNYSNINSNYNINSNIINRQLNQMNQMNQNSNEYYFNNSMNTQEEKDSMIYSTTQPCKKQSYVQPQFSPNKIKK